MRLTISFLIFFIAISFIAPSNFALSSDEEEKYIVLFKDKVNKDEIEAFRGEIEDEYENIPAVSISIPETAIEALEKNPNIIAIEPDQTIEIQQQTKDWGIERVFAPRAWQSGVTGKGINIAVVDTGIATHGDLIISGGVSFVSNSFIDDNGHGTHVAGIIAAQNNSFGTVGIAHESNIYAVKVLDKNGSGYLSDLIKGIDWAISNNMDIINLSLGAPTHSSSLQEIVEKAYSKGILVVAAAGNSGKTDGTGDTVAFPARYPTVIAVAATDARDARASFSATGSTVEVSAPGVRILSTHLNQKFSSLSGTSMAAGYVTGNIALLKQAHPSLSHTEIRKKLQQDTIDLGTPGRDSRFGFGLLQAPYIEEHDQLNQVSAAPTANELLEVVNNATTSSERLAAYIEGVLLYPNDQRFISGINTSSRSLLNWASQQHQNGRYDTAIGRYEFILSAPYLDKSISNETSVKLSYANQNKRIPTAQSLINLANTLSTSSERLTIFFNGFGLYPSDSRFEFGINANARSLLNWATQQHQQGQYVTASGRYEFILSAPILNNTIKMETETKLSYSKKLSKLPSPRSIIDSSNRMSTTSEKLTILFGGAHLYPGDATLISAINSNSQSLLNWATRQHQLGRFDTATGRYEFILSAPILNHNIKRETEIKLQYAKLGKKIPSAHSLLNKASSESTSSERLSLFIDGYLLYPEDSRFVTGINNNAHSLLQWASQQHQLGRFQTAIGRYEFILSSPVLRNNIRQTTRHNLSLAQQEKRLR
ncbi:S8 family peptidase [Bacillus alkalicellulosilyticus]|uniref:S8 family peptidase n=1 Tax=Alkalihalobacterium alkalicellulosilyticum TaxID=1912214 RepID=UPI001116785C|nr:S8 family peptidase [Bacillus alkalicellulosilyticus]